MTDTVNQIGKLNPAVEPEIERTARMRYNGDERMRLDALMDEPIARRNDDIGTSDNFGNIVDVAMDKQVNDGRNNAGIASGEHFGNVVGAAMSTAQTKNDRRNNDIMDSADNFGNIVDAAIGNSQTMNGNRNAIVDSGENFGNVVEAAMYNPTALTADAHRNNGIIESGENFGNVVEAALNNAPILNGSGNKTITETGENFGNIVEVAVNTSQTKQERKNKSTINTGDDFGNVVNTAMKTVQNVNTVSTNPPDTDLTFLTIKESVDETEDKFGDVVNVAMKVRQSTPSKSPLPKDMNDLKSDDKEEIATLRIDDKLSDVVNAAVKVQQPTAKAQQPTAKVQQPTSKAQQPTAKDQQPTAKVQQPTADKNNPFDDEIIDIMSDAKTMDKINESDEKFYSNVLSELVSEFSSDDRPMDTIKEEDEKSNDGVSIKDQRKSDLSAEPLDKAKSQVGIKGVTEKAAGQSDGTVSKPITENNNSKPSSSKSQKSSTKENSGKQRSPVGSSKSSAKSSSPSGDLKKDMRIEKKESDSDASSIVDVNKKKVKSSKHLDTEDEKIKTNVKNQDLADTDQLAKEKEVKKSDVDADNRKIEIEPEEHMITVSSASNEIAPVHGVENKESKSNDPVQNPIPQDLKEENGESHDNKTDKIPKDAVQVSKSRRGSLSLSRNGSVSRSRNSSISRSRNGSVSQSKNGKSQPESPANTTKVKNSAKTAKSSHEKKKSENSQDKQKEKNKKKESGNSKGETEKGLDNESGLQSINVVDEDSTKSERQDTDFKERDINEKKSTKSDQERNSENDVPAPPQTPSVLISSEKDAEGVPADKIKSSDELLDQIDPTSSSKSDKPRSQSAQSLNTLSALDGKNKQIIEDLRSLRSEISRIDKNEIDEDTNNDSNDKSEDGKAKGGLQRSRSLIAITAEENFLYVHGQSPTPSRPGSSLSVNQKPSIEGENKENPSTQTHSQESKEGNASTSANETKGDMNKEKTDQSESNKQSVTNQSIPEDGGEGRMTEKKDSGGKASTEGSGGSSVDTTAEIEPGNREKKDEKGKQEKITVNTNEKEDQVDSHNDEKDELSPENEQKNKINDEIISNENDIKNESDKLIKEKDESSSSKEGEENKNKLTDGPSSVNDGSSEDSNEKSNSDKEEKNEKDLSIDASKKNDESVEKDDSGDKSDKDSNNDKKKESPDKDIISLDNDDKKVQNTRGDVIVEALEESARSNKPDLADTSLLTKNPVSEEAIMPYHMKQRGTGLSAVEVPDNTISTVSLAVANNTAAGAGTRMVGLGDNLGGGGLYLDRFNTPGSLWQKQGPLEVKPPNDMYSREPREYEDYLPREPNRPILQRRGSMGKIVMQKSYDDYYDMDDEMARWNARVKESRGTQPLKGKSQDVRQGILKAADTKFNTVGRTEDNWATVKESKPPTMPEPIIIGSGKVPENLEYLTSEYQAIHGKVNPNQFKPIVSNNANNGNRGGGYGPNNTYSNIYDSTYNTVNNYYTNGPAGGAYNSFNNGSNNRTGVITTTGNNRGYPARERDQFQGRYYDNQDAPNAVDITAPLVAPQQKGDGVFDRLHANRKPAPGSKKPEVPPKPAKLTNAASNKAGAKDSTGNKPTLQSAAKTATTGNAVITAANNKGPLSEAEKKNKKNAAENDVFNRLYSNAPNRKRGEKITDENGRLLKVPDDNQPTDASIPGRKDSYKNPPRGGTKGVTNTRKQKNGDSVINMPLLAPDIVVDDIGDPVPIHGNMGQGDGSEDPTKLPIVLLQGFFSGPGTKSPHRRRPSVTNNEKTLPPDLLDVTSMIRGALPVLPRGLAALCLTLNIVVPGLGTMASGWLGICWGRNRLAAVETGGTRMTSVLVTGVTGLVQLFTVTFFLVGWFWGVAWGILLVSISNKYASFCTEHRSSISGSVNLEMLTVNAS